ncbi:hypothetical protein ACL03H_12505 [Saccharopolyspora sp. MS10]|uniref:hypothetical protein n=1 Tax=Saccharopolyspora sp. MS10 TaxID=3385973 RepID=UPI00399FB830
MGTALRIDSLAIEDHRGWQEPYDLSGRLVAIVGPIDRGKTSMVDCIDFALGREVKFRGAVAEHVVAVEAGVRIGEEEVFLRRKRKRSGSVEVLDMLKNPITELPVRPRRGEQGFSDWLLARLGLDEVFASVRLARGKQLSFAHDLLPYLHLRQDDIERFVVRPPSEDVARLVVAKLLLGLTSETTERLRARNDQLKAVIKSRAREVAKIEGFLDESLRTTATAIEDDLARLREEEARSNRRLEDLRERTRTATRSTDHLRRRLDNARQQLVRAEDVVDRALRQVAEATGELDHLDAALAELGQHDPAPPRAGEALSLLYTPCPACGADLGSREVPPGRCSLCTERLPGAARDQERDLLLHRRKHAAARLAECDRELERTRAAAGVAAEEHGSARQALAEAADTAVAPHVDDIAAAAEERQSLRSAITALQRLREPHRHLAAQREKIGELREKQEEVDADLVRAEAELTRPEDVFEHLDKLFRGIVDAFDLPWATKRARLSRTTLLPLVDEQDFDERGGGSRAAVSVAYSLTLLKHALEDPRFLLPPLLIIDSPQKNLGRNDTDEELATRMYEQISDYFEEGRRRAPGRFENVQLIVVDNDVPAGMRGRLEKLIDFENQEGFVRGLRHPHGRPAAPGQLELEVDLG